MNDQEREVISDIFRRLEQVADQPRDPEAERFIAERLRRQPYAPYAMAQAIYVQEQALANLHERVQQLESEVEQLRSRGQSGGFLSSLFGGGPREAERPMGGPFGQPGMPRAAGGQPGPWGGQPGMGGQPGPWGGQPGMGGQPGPFGAPQRGGSGFLGTALMTAAGVAGGMMLGNALASAFGGQQGGHGAVGGGQDAAANAGGGNYSDLSPFPDSGGSGGSHLHDASYDPHEDLGGDFGGDADGGDWA
jgi:hypothetical protein